MDYLNRVELRGRLTKDPELRYTPKGTPVANCSIATNRSVTAPDGEHKEFTEYHNLVAWQGLATQISELCKGDWVHAKGRIQTRSWQGQDGQKRRAFEIIIEEMLPAERKASASATAALDEAIN